MLTAAGVASAAVVAAVHWDDSPLVAIALGALVLVASLLTAIDFAVHRLPNVIVGPLALAVTLALLVGGAVSQDWGRVGFAVGVGVAASALFFVGNIIAGIGMGDVKYAYPVFATAAWFGAVPLQVTLLGMALSAAGVAIVVLVMGGGRGTAMAYGPYMSFGLVLGLVVAGLG